MLKTFDQSTVMFESDNFTGKAITTHVEDRWNFDVLVYINDVITDEYSKYIVNNRIRIVFNRDINGRKVEIIRQAIPSKLNIFGVHQGENFWERFYDALVQCCQDESIRRFQSEGKQIGFFSRDGFVVRIVSVIGRSLNELYQAIRTMPLYGFNRIWRAFTSILWGRNLYTGPLEAPIVTNLSKLQTSVSLFHSFLTWDYPLIETNAKDYVQNKITGLSELGANRFSFIKKISENQIVLYRFLYHPWMRAEVLAQLGTEYDNAVAHWGARKINYIVRHEQEQITLTKTTESSIITNAQGTDEVNTLSLVMGDIQVPLIIGFNNIDEGVNG